MKQLASAPLLLSLLLTIPLWLVLDNIIVALLAGLLLAFLIAMARSLYILKTQAGADPAAPPSPPISGMTPDTAPAAAPTADITMLPASTMPSGLQQPDAESLAHSHAVQAHLGQQVTAAGGFLPFAQYMHHALYAPGLGYYAAESAKFGAGGGDFTTAPELTPLFGRALAAQVAQVLQESGSLHVLEFGAGSGALAASLIPALRELGIEPHYRILEVSSNLRARQQERLAPLQARVQWLDSLPASFMGCVIANEVLDAMPCNLFRWDEQGQPMELGVVVQAATATPLDHATDAPSVATTDTMAPAASPALHMAQRPAAPALRDVMAQRMPPLPGYRSECNLQAEAWIRQMGSWLQQGAALLIDYGFPQREYYHPQRAEGTLMCHFRHHAHGDPLLYPGLQDITAHIDFTAMADAALEGGLEVLGYTAQARFLMNCGIVPLLSASASQDDSPSSQAQALSAAQKLLSEAEMGELFKVLAIGRGLDTPLLGFAQGDRRHRL